MIFTWLHNFIIACSKSWWKMGLLIVGFGLTFSQLSAVTAEFPGLAVDNSLGDSVVPFDMQNELTASQLFAQLAVWSEQSFARYTWFQIVDFFFPLVAGLMSAGFAALGLRLLSTRLYNRAVAKGLFLLFLLATLCDWMENAGFIWVLSAWPEQSLQAAGLAIGAKKLKLACLVVFQPIWIGLLLLGSLTWSYRKIRDRLQAQAAAD